MRNRLMITAVASLALTSVQACDIVPAVTYTFYGFPDNEPAGHDIAYDCGRGRIAGGVGTFNDPLTFASAPGEFTQCEIIFAPYLHKYLRFEDHCSRCADEWNSSIYHIDIWTGSNTTDGGQDQINCEMSLTPTGSLPIVRNPSANLTVDTTPLYVPGGNPSCNVDHVYSNESAQNFC
ncbi:uncharacterized protein CDV56_106715 [Aspergillus thermomutatus]|uniref:Uncharacterized protein n=1 Tax=Aspergillus thermomutatus TaxID=41047 RepID=A0A397HNP9_ASPTH|nr:uncharacterized protein CDV56_106715 [Aspergillus thermomutatus]RHZ63226.1 hypothetical protein CDV56_106715 [Aspergillus thermomutatus]